MTSFLKLTFFIISWILLFLLVITYLVASYFALRTWRRFKRDMSNGKESTEPSAWARLRFRMENLKLPNVAAVDIRERFGRLLNRNQNDPDDAQIMEANEVTADGHSWIRDGDLYVDMKEKPTSHGSSLYSDSHKSRHSSRNHHGHGSRSSGSKMHYDDEKQSHHGSSHHGHHGSGHRGHSHHGNKSSRSGASSRSSEHRGHERSSHREHKKENEALDAKTIVSLPSEGGPVASVMC